MAIEIFNRRENKYRINSEQFELLNAEFAKVMTPDKFCRDGKTYCINNIYYDTPDNSLIRTSLAKPTYKEKLRLRAYGIPDNDSKVFVEIKKKVNGVVNKRRTTMKLNEAYRFLQNGAVETVEPDMNKQVVREIEYMLSHYKLQPTVALSYERLAYFGDNDLRVSFDRNIRTRRNDLALERGTHGDELLDKGEWLMEIKTSKAYPVWLCKLLSENKIYPTSFSKYGEEYKEYLKCSNQFSYQVVEQTNSQSEDYWARSQPRLSLD